MSDNELADSLGRSFRATKFRRGDILGLHRKNFGKYHTIEEVFQLFERRNYELISKEYKNNHEKLDYICIRHKDKGVQQITLGHFLTGEGCKYCGYERTAKAKMVPDEHYIKWCHANNCTYIGRYIKNNQTHIQFMCNKHLNLGIQEKSITNLEKTNGCPHCKSSKGENHIEDILVKNNIEYIRQKRFVECRDKYTLPFDFYIPKYNVAIEYDGEQHYEPIPFTGDYEVAVKEHIDTKRRDEIKNKYCEDNNITLIRIPYYTEDIESFLLSNLNKGKAS